MNSDREIADAVKAAQRLLWHTYDLPDAMKVVRLRKLVRSPTVQSAMQRCSDTLLAFTLRAVALVIADQSRSDNVIDLTSLNPQKAFVEKSFDLEPRRLQSAIETGSFEIWPAPGLDDTHLS